MRSVTFIVVKFRYRVLCMYAKKLRVIYAGMG